MKKIFITGGTGYIGKRLIKRLLAKGHHVTALVRRGSEKKLPTGVVAVIADPFSALGFQYAIPKGAVFVQLLGVAHPSPRKVAAFRTIDLASVKASADAASYAGVSHFVYVSVSMSETKLMKAYQDVRKEGEEYCLAKKLTCTFIRPWYVIGPGHWWPLLLLPFYGLAELIPSWKEKTRSKGLVTLNQMLDTLVNVIEANAMPLQVLEIADIKKATP